MHDVEKSLRTFMYFSEVCRETSEPWRIPVVYFVTVELLAWNYEVYKEMNRSIV